MNATGEREANEIEELLPWHAAGTLGHGDRERVEAALARDPKLARRYELVREELAQTIHLNETLGSPSPRAMAALFAKIDAEPARRPAASLNLAARVGEFFAALSPRTLAWSASAAALAILLQAGFIAGILLHEKRSSGYETAVAPSTIERQRRLRPDPIPAPGQRRRRHEVSGNQQTQYCGGTLGRRTIPSAHCGDEVAASGCRADDQDAAAGSGCRPYRADQMIDRGICHAQQHKEPASDLGGDILRRISDRPRCRRIKSCCGVWRLRRRLRTHGRIRAPHRHSPSAAPANDAAASR